MFKEKLKKYQRRALAFTFALAIGVMLSFSQSSHLSAEEKDTNQRFLFEELWRYDGYTYPVIVLAENINGEYVLKENEKGLPKGVIAYCLDRSLDWPQGENLNYDYLSNMDTYYSKKAQEKVRAILMEGFPNKSLKTLQQLPGLSNLNIGQAHTATQFAIWYTVESNRIENWQDTISVYLTEPEEIALYNYLLNLDPIEAPKDSLDINITNKSAKYDDEKNLVLTMNFEFNQQNADDSAIEPIVNLTESIKKSYPNAVVTVNDDQVTIEIPNGEYDINSKTIDLSFSFDFELISSDMFFVGPMSNVGGFQNLGAVGLISSTILKEVEIQFTIPEPIEPIGQNEPKPTEQNKPEPTEQNKPEPTDKDTKKPLDKSDNTKKDLPNTGVNLNGLLTILIITSLALVGNSYYRLKIK